MRLVRRGARRKEREAKGCLASLLHSLRPSQQRLSQLEEALERAKRTPHCAGVENALQSVNTLRLSVQS